jgi:hypothetical protein
MLRILAAAATVTALVAARQSPQNLLVGGDAGPALTAWSGWGDAGLPQDGSAARFDDVAVFIFPTEVEARRPTVLGR